MKERFLRIYKKLDISDIQKYILIFGDLSAQCGNCQALDVGFDVDSCPQCRTPIRYISFRNIKSHLPKMQRIAGQRPAVTFVDYEDYRRIAGEIKAQEFLK